MLRQHLHHLNAHNYAISVKYLLCLGIISSAETYNISKCFAMYVPAARHATPRDDFQLSQLTIDASSISLMDEMKILGVTFTTTLSWFNHANKVRSKFSRMSRIYASGCALDGYTRQRIFRRSFNLMSCFACQCGVI